MKVIDSESPLGCLRIVFPKVRLFSGLPARVFGCVVFMHQNSGKLDPRALCCIFVRNSGTQKGYRCYHPPSRKFFVSADVVFNESELYYKSETSSAMASPKKEATNLEFLHLVEFIPIGELAITSAEKDGKDAGHMNPSPEEKDEQPKVKDSQDNVEVEADQGDSSALIDEPTLNSQV